MAYVGIPIAGGLHITLVHIEIPKDAERKNDWEIGVNTAISDLLARARSEGRTFPTATWGRAEMMGRYRNVKAILIDSPGIRGLRAGLVSELARINVPISETFGPGYVPHVTKAPLQVIGGEVRLEQWIEFVSKPNTWSHEL